MIHFYTTEMVYTGCMKIPGSYEAPQVTSLPQNVTCLECQEHILDNLVVKESHAETVRVHLIDGNITYLEALNQLHLITEGVNDD